MWVKTDRFIENLERKINITKEVRQIAFNNMQCGFYNVSTNKEKFKKCALCELGDYYDIKQDNYTIYKLLNDDNTGALSYPDIDEIENLIVDDFREYLKENNYITKNDREFYKNEAVFEICEKLKAEYLKNKKDQSKEGFFW